MNTTQINALVPGREYRVQIRYTQFSHDGKFRHTFSRRIRRTFFGTDLRFGSIPCAVFSSANSGRMVHAQELSVPHYDLVSADPVNPGREPIR
jgi:hypothetical protein